jgi:hypothetical protein
MTTTTREIKFDRESRDFALYLDGQVVGFAGTYQEGDEVLNALETERAKRAAADAVLAEPAVTAITISAEPRKRRVQIVRFVGLTVLRSRTYRGVTAASFARLARLMARGAGRTNFAELAPAQVRRAA